MPAPLDLTGRVFGQLTVLHRDGYMQFGKRQAAWLCLCECGREERIPQGRLPHRASIPTCHVVTACEQCRFTRTCKVCGKSFFAPNNQTTCSEECRHELQKQTGREHYHRKAADPEFNQRRHARTREKMAIDPDFARHVLAQRSAIWQRRKQKRQTDPAERDRINAAARERYRLVATETQERRRMRYAALPIEKKIELAERDRDYQREWRQRWREKLFANPSAHTVYLKRQRKWASQRALRQLQSDLMRIKRGSDND